MSEVTLRNTAPASTISNNEREAKKAAAKNNGLVFAGIISQPLTTEKPTLLSLVV